MAEQTVKEWLDGLAGGTSSTDKDSRMMQSLLHRVGFPEAIVTCGIVYLAGKGTLEAPPTSIHSVVKMLLAAA